MKKWRNNLDPYHVTFFLMKNLMGTERRESVIDADREGEKEKRKRDRDSEREKERDSERKKERE